MAINFPARSLLHVRYPLPRYWRKERKERKGSQEGKGRRTFLRRRARLCAIGRAFSRGQAVGSRIYSPRSIAVYYSSIGGGTALWQLSPQRFSMIREFHRPAPIDGWRISRRINGPLLFYRGGKYRSLSNEPLARGHDTLLCGKALAATFSKASKSPRDNATSLKGGLEWA